VVQQRPAKEFGGELIRRSKTFRPTGRQNDARDLVRRYTHSHVPELDDAERQRDCTSYPDFYARANKPWMSRAVSSASWPTASIGVNP
jgi:hypothetical protein